MHLFRQIALVILLLATTPGAAPAQTVDEIVARGSINIGVLIDVPPFGSLNGNQEPDGYDADVARLLGKYLGVKVNLVPVTSPNRIPFLLTNKVDIVIATFGITPERARAVMFSIPYSSIPSTVFASQDKKITKIDDLRGLRVGVTRGTTQDVLISGALGAAVRMVRFDDDASTYQAMLSGQVDALAHNGFVGRQYFGQNAALRIEPKFELPAQPNGMTMRANQWNLHQWVNTFVFFVKNNGELNAISEKWLKIPLGELPVF